MRKYLFAFFPFMMLLLCPSNTEAAQETLAHRIVRQRDFFLHLNGYPDNYICDIEVIEKGKSIGIILLSPEGFEQQLVFDIASMRILYANARILSKYERDFLTGASIRMSEAKRLAYAAKMRAAELSRGSVRDGKAGNIIDKQASKKKVEIKPNSNQKIAAAQNYPDSVTRRDSSGKNASRPEPVDDSVAAMIETRVNKGHISNISKEIEDEVAAMSTKEILERFRAEVKLHRSEAAR